MGRNAILSAFALVLVSITLGSTIFREQAAQAAQAILSVREHNIDADGNIRVHEQGTARVDVTNVGLRKILIAEDLAIPQGGAVLTPWVETSDCRRVTAVIRGGFIKFSLRTSVDGSLVDAVYEGRRLSLNLATPLQHTIAFALTDSEYSPAEQVELANMLMAAPWMRLFIESPVNPATIDEAWLYCMR